jgi:hypothetical protein
MNVRMKEVAVPAFVPAIFGGKKRGWMERIARSVIPTFAQTGLTTTARPARPADDVGRRYVSRR